MDARLDLAAGATRSNLEAQALIDNKASATTVPASALVVLIGAEPRTGWLPGIMTGLDQVLSIYPSLDAAVSAGPAPASG